VVKTNVNVNCINKNALELSTFKNARKNRRFINTIKNLMSVYAKQAANLNNNSGLPNKIYAEYIFFAWLNPKTNVFCLPIILSDTKNLKFSEKNQLSNGEIITYSS
jgi:hypothetical protein